MCVLMDGWGCGQNMRVCVRGGAQAERALLQQDFQRSVAQSVEEDGGVEQVQLRQGHETCKVNHGGTARQSGGTVRKAAVVETLSRSSQVAWMQ
eukprot:357676-Chlamydomonas_euryale.AAC.1